MNKPLSESQKRSKNKDKKLNQRTRKRLVQVCVVFAVVLFLLCIRIIYIAAVEGKSYEKTIAYQQDSSSKTLAYRRGTITDRNNTVLATSERVYTMILDPKVILADNSKNKNASVGAVVEVFGYDKADIEKNINDNPESSYVRYKKEITEDDKIKFDNYKAEYNKSYTGTKDNEDRVVGVWFEEEYKRTYPFNTLACSLLGFSGSDSSRGNWGIEEYYNSELIGINGREYGYVGEDGNAKREVSAAKDGNTVVSTIDYTVQLAAENAIAQYTLNHEADNVAAIVMNPQNGEILAMATDKQYNLNDPSDLSYLYTEEEIKSMSDEEKEKARGQMWKNYTIADSYEPGSTAKPFTLAAALECNTTNDNRTYNCTGSRTIFDTTIHCNNRSGHGMLNPCGGIMQSCNCVMMDLVEELGAENFLRYQSIFGFGKQSGIDLPGETTGLLYNKDNISKIDLATNSFGQNFTVNMVQLSSAFASLVNGGNYYKPHVVKQILSSNGDVIKNVEPTLIRKTVSESTEKYIKNSLFKTVEEGTGLNGLIKGYSVGGKTGTAEKLPRGTGEYLVSFIAAAPIDNPEILIYVVVDNPKVTDGDPGAYIAIEIEKQIMEAIIPYTNIPASDYSAIDSESLGGIFEFVPTKEEIASPAIGVEAQEEISDNPGEENQGEPVDNDSPDGRVDYNEDADRGGENNGG